MSKNIILSICIPTYNRPEKLKVILSQLLPQMTGQCEIIVRDDSNNELSKKVFDQALSGKKLNKAYFHGEKIGLDLANIFLLEKARGKFVWWFSDDDELMDGAVQHLLNIVNIHDDITFIWANFISSFSGRPAVTNRKEGFFKNNGEFLNIVGPSIGLLSCFILNRERGLPFKEVAKSRSIGFGFASMVPIFGAISENDKIYFLRGPFIINHPTDMQTIEDQSKSRVIDKGSLAFEVYAINFPDTLRLFEKNLDEKAIRKLVARNFSHFWKGFIIGIGKGYDTVRGKRIELIKRYWWHPEFIPAFALMNMPQSFLFTMYKSYKVIKAKITR